MNVKARLEFELAYDDFVVHRFNHYTTQGEWTWESWQWRRTQYFPKLQDGAYQSDGFVSYPGHSIVASGVKPTGLFIIWSRRNFSSEALLLSVFAGYSSYFCCIFIPNRLIGPVGRVFVNGPGDLGSIPGRVLPKTLKMVLDTSLLNIQQYKVRIEGKWSNPRKGIAPSPTRRCSSYWKGSLLVPLDYGRQLLLLFTRSFNKKL